jgi:alpha-glucosidase
MQWDASPGVGFGNATPWLPVADDYPLVNVASERSDPSSRCLIRLRRCCQALTEGSYSPLPSQDNVLSYERRHGDQRLLVALNFDSAPKEVMMPSRAEERVLLSTYKEPSPVSRPLTLRPDEGVVIGDLQASGLAA